MDDEHTIVRDVLPRRILVVKLSSLGDIVHTLPAVSALRQRFASAHICWLVKSEWASILEGNPDVDEVLSVPLSWQDWPMFIKNLRQLQCDLVVDFQGLFRTGLFGVLSGAKRRVGFSRAREGAAWMYTDHVSLPGDDKSPWRLLAMHAVDRNLAIAKFLGSDISRPIFHLPGFAEDDKAVHDMLQDMAMEKPKGIIALAPWSRSMLKAWPLDRFIELAEELVRSSTLRVVVLGGSSDRGLANEFHHLEAQGLLNLVGKLSLRQLPGLLRKTKLLVGNDSSLIHLAAGVGTPVLAIFGPTEPKATGPYPSSQHIVARTELACSPCGQRTCHHSPYLECLQSISVHSLLGVIRQQVDPLAP